MNKLGGSPVFPATISGVIRQLTDYFRRTWSAVNWLMDGFSGNTVSVTSAYTVTRGITRIFADATGGAFTVTLQPAAEVTDTEILIVRMNAGANAVTVDGDGSETINGSTTASLGSQYAFVHLVTNGTEWVNVA
jgi:hypothetical protein